MSLCRASHFIYCYAECRYAECRYAECCYAECRYAECHYAECRFAECRGTSPTGLCNKTLWICNLHEIDRFCSEPVLSGLDKHSSLLRGPYIMNP